MSRPLHSQYNDNLFDTYLNTIMKTTRKHERPRIDTGRTISTRDKSLNRLTNNQLVVSRPATKSRIEEIHPKPESQELVRKEVYNNSMATVEVTVRTVAPKGLEGKSAEDTREPWSKLLANRKSDDNIPGTFGHFDPLRTLHFLSKELQMKLQSVCPSDSNVQQIISDMNNAIQRLPPDIITQFTANSYVSASAGDAEVPINLKNPNSNNIKPKCNQESQTIVVGDADTKMMQKKLEESASKLETNCREMEDLCNKLRRERGDLESMLVVEKETVLHLREQLKDVVAEEEEKLANEIRKVSSERDSLKMKVTDLQTQLESQVGQTTEDIRLLVESLKNKQLEAELENTTIRNELTIVKLERDKINVLLDCKDKQLKELRNELECIQQLISNQLHELRTKPTISTTSTLSSASQFWNIPSSRSQKFSTSIHELFLNNDIMRKMLSTKDLQTADSATTNITLNDKNSIAKYTDDIQIIPQKERSIKSKLSSTVAFSDATISVDYNKSSHISIKDVFSQIKRQAFEKYNVTNLEVHSPELLDDSKSNRTKSSRCESRASQSS